jgi:transcriptional regulator with XRE-family HTH domain
MMAKNLDASMPRIGRNEQLEPSAMDAWVGSRLKIRRTQLGISAARLADALGITRQAVDKIERGDSRITAGRLAEAAQFLEVGPAWFFEGCPTIAMPIGSAPGLAEVATPEGMDLLAKYNRLLPEQRRAIRLFTDACTSANAADAHPAALPEA